jgi:hypothetical protein
MAEGDATERFMDAAVRPLEDNAEMQVGARHKLGELISKGKAPNAEALERTAKRLEKAGTPRRWPVWKVALYALTLILSAVSLVAGWRNYWMVKDVSEYLSPMGSGPGKSLDELMGESLSGKDRFLLLGDTRRSSKADQVKALWDAEPESAAYFSEYAIYYERQHNTLPPDFLKTAEALDPENAWPILMAAADAGKGSVERLKLTAKEKKAGVKPGYKIIDEKRFRESLELIARAGEKPRFDSYQAGLLKQRIPVLPKRTDFPSQVLPLGYLAGLPADTLDFRKVMDVVDARAAELGAAGDKEGFRKLAESWEHCLQTWLASDAASLIDVLVIKVCINATAMRFGETARNLGMDQEAERWDAIANWIKEDKDAREKRTRDPMLKMKGGVFVGLGLPAVAAHSRRAPKITEEDLKPSRMVDHEFLSRGFSLLVWAALGLMAAAAALYRFRASPLVRRLAQRFQALFGPVDWLWILGGGIVMPFVYYLVIYRLTLLGARDWSPAASGFMVPSGQFTGAGYLMMVMPVLIARWRLGMRGEVMGFKKTRSWPAWIGVACGVLAIPAFGLSFMIEGSRERVLIAAGVLLGVLQLAWLMIAVRALFGKRDQLLRRLTITRALVPAYVLGMLLMAASMPIYHAAEKRWMAQERLTEITAEAPSWTRYEHDVAKAAREELRELLNQ